MKRLYWRAIGSMASLGEGAWFVWLARAQSLAWFRIATAPKPPCGSLLRRYMCIDGKVPRHHERGRKKSIIKGTHHVYKDV
jgi:hypothetical protein